MSLELHVRERERERERETDRERERECVCVFVFVLAFITWVSMIRLSVWVSLPPFVLPDTRHLGTIDTMRLLLFVSFYE